MVASYDPEQREAMIVHILAEVSAGRSVASILAEDDGMPASTTFWRWHMDDENLRDNLARARQNGVEHRIDECVAIADTANDRDSAAAAKVRVDTRLKLAQMIAPRKYGPKLDVTSGGEKLNMAETLAARRQQVAEKRDGN